MSLKQTRDLVDLAVRIIDRHLNLEKNPQMATTVDEADVAITQFNKRYTRGLSVPPYDSFNTCGDNGIPRLVRFFTSFDPINAVGPFTAWTDYVIAPTDLEARHVHSYLSAPEFNKGLLSSNKYDAVVHAIYSYLLTWTNEGLMTFADHYPRFKAFLIPIALEKDRAPVYVIEKLRIPFVRSSFRMLAQYFRGEDPKSAMRVDRPLFSVAHDIPYRLIVHFKQVYVKLLNEQLTRNDINLIETTIPSPFLSTALEFSGKGTDVNVKRNVLTGQACCGKTSLLESLRTQGWSICSRGFLGTFSGKSKSPAAMAGLHAALENALCRGDVLGDRGAIDNPLWNIIMPLCDPKYKDCVVDEIITYFNGTINEHVIAYMHSQNVVVFIDPRPSKNRERMMTRCAGGDAYRARIHMYPITQFIAYYMAARLFGWRVRCVPYDDHGNFQPQNYVIIAEEISKSFGKPIPQQPLGMASKASGVYLEDNEYSVATGIFK